MSEGRSAGAARGGFVRALGALDAVVAKFEVWVLAYGVLLMAANSVANVAGRFLLRRASTFRRNSISS